MNKRIIGIISIIVMIYSGSILAENIYKKGSLGHHTVEKMGKYIPDDLTIIFMLKDDTSTFFRDVDESLLRSEKTLRSVIKRSIARPYNTNFPAYSSTMTLKVKGGYKSFCRANFLTMNNFNFSHMHEMMHCITNAKSEIDDVNKAIIPTLNIRLIDSFGHILPDEFKVTRFHEVHAYVLADIIMGKTGLDSDMAGQVFRAKNTLTYPVVQSATNYAIKMCRTMGCSEDPSTLASQLVSDSSFMDIFLKDLLIESDYISRKKQKAQNNFIGLFCCS